MANVAKVRPWRSLILLLVITAGLCAWAFWPGQSHTPRLGLDLQGGTQVTLVPKSANGGGDVTPEQLEQSVEIIRQRVNGLGVSEAEVTTQGSGGSSAIIVSVPGENRQGLEQQLSQTALLDFRPVVLEESSAPTPAPEPSVVPTPSPTTTKKAKKGSSARTATTPTPTPSPSAAAPDPTKMRPPIQAPTTGARLQRA